MISTATNPTRKLASLATEIKLALHREQQLTKALAPFVAAYLKTAEPIGDSDLYDEQPRSVAVTLGDCRRAARVFRTPLRPVVHARPDPDAYVDDEGQDERDFTG